MTAHFLAPLLQHPDRRHRLVNESRGVVLAHSIEAALDARSRRRGLLGRDGLAADSVLIIAPCESIHTFFMRFPIDVVFVRRDGTVARAFADVPKRRIRAAWRGFAALEFAAGAVVKSGTAIGDRLVLAEA
jgi:uncharacterized protein